MFIAFSVDGVWRIGWGHASWHLVPESQLLINADLDGVAYGVVGATAVAPTMVLVELSTTHALLGSLTKARLLAIHAEGSIYTIPLDTLDQALAELTGCVTRHGQQRNEQRH